MERTIGRKIQDWFFGGVVGCLIVLVVLAVVFIFGAVIFLALFG